MKVLKLSNLCTLSASLLAKLGLKGSGRIHSTRLKNKILAHVPDLRDHLEGKDVLVAFDQDIGHVLKVTLQEDCDDEGIALARAAKIICRDLFNKKVPQFRGTFQEADHEYAVPKTLLSLMRMILHGPDVKDETTLTEVKAAQNISELVVFNACTPRSGRGKVTHHSKDREPPLPLYVGLAVHACTHSCELVNVLYQQGLSVSYPRLLHVTTGLANSVIAYHESQGVVCPSNLCQNLFTSGMIDNIDHNPSSTISPDHRAHAMAPVFHLCNIQHLKTQEQNASL